ncbi:MAG: methionine--tRNA ligase [Akkermansia sp.]|nr:methionine--tRNA ligase [Akkermansia sp.]
MFYITTAIDYTNGSPHIGHAYEKVLADVLARWHRMCGEDTFLLTGVDQHGQKVQQKAEEAGVSPQEYADTVTKRFVALWERLGISYDGWAATTDARHKACVQKILTNLKEKGCLYKKAYKGFYSVRQEQFLTDKERGEDGNFGPEWGQVIELEEENWYFNLTAHTEWLKEFVTTHPECVTPDFRRQDLLMAIERATNDLCISRPKDRLSWGIPLPFDPDFVTYVWFDALINYISFAGYLSDGDPSLPDFNKLWPAACEVIGKDILVPAHGIYWLCMLHAMGFSDAEMPRLLVHGWLNIKGEKMSKSLGNIVDPNDLCDVFGPEAVRYYLVRDTKTGYDSDYDAERMKMLYNTELANDLGNLCNRSLNMCTRYLGGVVTVAPELATDELSVELRESMAATVARFSECMNAYSTSEALAALNAHVGRCNAYIEKTQPFALAKDEARLPELQNVLAHLLESCVQVGYLIACVLPDASARILSQLQVDPATLSPQTLAWGILKDGHQVQAPSPVFPRILSEEEKQKMAERAAKAAAKAARKAAAPQQ